MIPFAVQVPGDAADKGHWVLEVDAVGERVLIAKEDKTLCWVGMKECVFLRAHSPEMVTPVVAVQPQAQRPQLTVPHFNGKATRP